MKSLTQVKQEIETELRKSPMYMVMQKINNAEAKAAYIDSIVDKVAKAYAVEAVKYDRRMTGQGVNASILLP